MNSLNFYNLLEPIQDDIKVERIRQNVKFTQSSDGIQFHNIFTWLAILGEEVGEANQAALDYIFKGPGSMDYGVKTTSHLREELVQVSAAAVAIIERLDDRDSSLWKEEPIMKEMNNENL